MLCSGYVMLRSYEKVKKIFCCEYKFLGLKRNPSFTTMTIPNDPSK